MTMGNYRIAVDIGGTFTDCVVAAEGGERTVAKSLTTPGSLQDGVLDALQVAAEEIGSSRRELLAATSLFVHGTTQATNALLTRTGARTGLMTTRGHEDAMLIGKFSAKVAGLPEREVVHASQLRKPEPIVPRDLIRGITERVDRDGDVVVELQEDTVAEAIDALVGEGVEAIAVSLLWSPPRSSAGGTLRTSRSSPGLRHHPRAGRPAARRAAAGRERTARPRTGGTADDNPETR